MSNKKDLKKQAGTFFGLYPNKAKLWATEDGNFFLLRSDAMNHAHACGTNYFEFERSQDETEKEPGSEQDEITAEFLMFILRIDADTADYHEMCKLLAGLNVAPESKKKADVIMAVKNFQAKAKLNKINADKVAEKEAAEATTAPNTEPATET